MSGGFLEKKEPRAEELNESSFSFARFLAPLSTFAGSVAATAVDVTINKQNVENEAMHTGLWSSENTNTATFSGCFAWAADSIVVL